MHYNLVNVIDNFPVYLVDVEKSYIRALATGRFNNDRLEREKERISRVTLTYEKDLRNMSRSQAFTSLLSRLKNGKRFNDLMFSIGEIGKSGLKDFSVEELWTIQIIAGEAQFEKGDLDGAEHTFQKIIIIQPGNIEAYNNLGAVYFKQGKFWERSY